MAKKKILLVEDDFYIRDIYKTALKGRGFNVIDAQDGKEAIELYDKNNVDLVLLDIMLPQINGPQVLEHIRNASENDGHTPVIILTNVDNTDVEKQVSKLEPEEYFIKSAIKITKLADRIEKMLNHD